MKKYPVLFFVFLSVFANAKNKFAFPKGTHQIMWYVNSEILRKHFFEYTYTPDSSKYAYSVFVGYSDRDLRITQSHYLSPDFNMIEASAFRFCIGLHQLSNSTANLRNRIKYQFYGKIDFRYLNETGSYIEEQSSSGDELRQYKDYRITNLLNVNGIVGVEFFLLKRKYFVISYYMEGGLGFQTYQLLTLSYSETLRGSLWNNHYIAYNPPITEKVNAPKIVLNIGFKLGLKWKTK